MWRKFDYFFVLCLAAGVFIFGFRCGKDAGREESYKTAYKLGFKDGWMEYSIDSTAVSYYHQEADELENDEDRAELARIWDEATRDATTTVSEWYSIDWEERMNAPFRAFWLSGKGQPRRISRRQAKDMIDQLQQPSVRTNGNGKKI